MIDKWVVTYEVVTPQSAIDGDAAERGFMRADHLRSDDAAPMTLREAARLVGCCEDSGRWLTETDGRDDYRTGANERRSLHPPDRITGSSYRRVARLFGAGN